MAQMIALRRRRRIAGSEAHIPSAHRTAALVYRVARPRSSPARWAVFFGLILANELRGIYVAAEAWRAIFG